MFAKNERGYRLTAKNIRWGSLLILLLCYVYKEKVLKTTHTEELASIKFRKLQYSTNVGKNGGTNAPVPPPLATGMSLYCVSRAREGGGSVIVLVKVYDSVLCLSVSVY